MNPERISIYYDLMRIGIGSESVKLFQGAPKRFYRINGACFMLETSLGKYALWLISDEESRLIDELKLLDILQKNRIEGFLYPIHLKNNRCYGHLEDGRFFYITSWHELRRISYRNDIRSLLKLITDFRMAICSSEASFLMKAPLKSLVDRYQDMIKYVNSFAMLASHRLYPTVFDQVFLKHWGEFVNEAELALKLIRSCAYLSLFGAKESFRPIINNFSRSNLGVLPNGQVICISLKERALDAPLMDLALLMVKTARANHWNQEWYDKTIEVYNESFPLTNEELGILRAYLAFPWEMYRLAARYYHNRVNWPVSVFVEKMKRILESKAERDKLLEL